MPVKHVWPTVQAAIASLQAGLPARVAAFNLEPGHGVTVTAPAAAAYYAGGSDLLTAGSFPAVEVHIARGELGRPSEGIHSDTGFAVNHVEGTMIDDVVVVIWDEGGEGEVPLLYEQITGLGRCALEVLLPNGAFGGSAEVTHVSYEYAIVPGNPAEERRFQKWRTAVVLVFRVEDVTAIS